ncbi:MAG TPA: hypothetical protein VHR67_11195, partial [Aestuariivirgaceae bacterium]|nr:hypothetical protein [Aestuariivirgaceae bacterium]
MAASGLVGDAGQPYSRNIKDLGGRLDPQIVTRFCGFLNVVSTLQFTSRAAQPKTALVVRPKYLKEGLAWGKLKRVPRAACIELPGDYHGKNDTWLAMSARTLSVAVSDFRA